MRKLIAFFVLSSLPLAAQFEYGEVLGVVRDSSGAVIAKAKVQIRSADTNAERSIVTNDEGVFAFAGLRIGAYKVRVEQAGFKAAETSIPALRVGDRLRIDMSLQPGLKPTPVRADKWSD
jgi:Carboxypeptidase regulatory-like domain